MPSEYEALRATAQWTLIEFLHTELKIAVTFVQSALLARSDGHVDHYAQAKRDAVKAAEAVRRFMGHVVDDALRTEIGSKLAELDRLISSL